MTHPPPARCGNRQPTRTCKDTVGIRCNGECGRHKKCATSQTGPAFFYKTFFEKKFEPNDFIPLGKSVLPISLLCNFLHDQEFCPKPTSFLGGFFTHMIKIHKIREYKHKAPKDKLSTHFKKTWFILKCACSSEFFDKCSSF